MGEKRNHQLGALFGFIFLVLLVEIMGKWLTDLSVHDWYPTLNKPEWRPPNWVFGPVWTALYLMMAIAAWLVYRSTPSSERTLALGFFFVQLLFNLMWSGLFFGLRSPLLGLIDISFLWMFVFCTVFLFCRVNGIAGLLLAPYLIWVSYAAILNAVIVQLNQ